MPLKNSSKKVQPFWLKITSLVQAQRFISEQSTSCSYALTLPQATGSLVVQFHVPPQVGYLGEALIAVLADESLLPGVDDQVLPQLLFSVKGLAAVLAREVLLASVMLQVRVHVAGAAERLAAHLAGERTLAIVHLH